MQHTLYFIFRPRAEVLAQMVNPLPEMEYPSLWSMQYSDRSPWSESERLDSAKLLFLAKMRVNYGGVETRSVHSDFEVTLAFFDRCWTVEVFNNCDSSFEDAIDEVKQVEDERTLLAAHSALLRQHLEQGLPDRPR